MTRGKSNRDTSQIVGWSLRAGDGAEGEDEDEDEDEDVERMRTRDVDALPRNRAAG